MKSLICTFKTGDKKNRLKIGSDAQVVGDLTIINEPINDRFLGDFGSENNHDFYIAVQGCILNSEELIRQYSAHSLTALIQDLFVKYGGDIVKYFKGSYVICIYEKAKKTFYVFNDLLSKRPIYWSENMGEVAVSTSFALLMDVLKQNGIKTTINTPAVAMILQKGVMIGDVTYANEVKFLKPFYYLCVNENGAKTIKSEYPQGSIDTTEKAIFPRLDELFSLGLTQQFQKNAKSNYRQMATLSGGMDSRMMLLYSKRLNLDVDMTITMAESKSADQIISESVASHYGFKNIFYSFDNGKFLIDRERMITRSEGLLYYAGTTGLNDFLSFIDTDKMGILHTGLGGGELMGADILKPMNGNNDVLVNQFIKTYSCSDEKVNESIRNIIEGYKDFNEMRTLNDLRTCVNFMRTCDPVCNAFSPFLYEDFFVYVKDLPLEMKLFRKLYVNWVREYTPNHFENTYHYGKMHQIPMLQFINRGIDLVAGRLLPKTRYDMNPFDCWWNVNEALATQAQKWLDDECPVAMELVPELAGMISDIKGKRAMAKFRLLTATWSLIRYFGS